MNPCKYGAKCDRRCHYSHPGDPVKICKYFLHGWCKRKDCKFSHGNQTVTAGETKTSAPKAEPTYVQAKKPGSMKDENKLCQNFKKLRKIIWERRRLAEDSGRDLDPRTVKAFEEFETLQRGVAALYGQSAALLNALGVNEAETSA